VLWHQPKFVFLRNSKSFANHVALGSAREWNFFKPSSAER
jgi:hypothetical protein